MTHALPLLPLPLSETAPSRAWRRTLMACAVMALAAGCSSNKPAPVAPPPAPPAQAASAPVETPAAPVAPPTAAAQQQAQKIAMSVVDLLEAGNEEAAHRELQNALRLDPGNKLALNLSRQMAEDPVQALGRESFAYVVRPGDTLSKIAGRFLGDIYSFHILARYNNIKVPRQVGEGQTIRVPGKAPAMLAAPTPPTSPSVVAKPSAAPAPAAPTAATSNLEAALAAPAAETQVSAADAAFRSAQAAASEGKLDRALAEYRRAAGLGHSTAGAQADAISKRLVEDHSRAARAAFARQDLDGTVRAWDRVLALDPNNETAKLERQKALRLKDKVKAL